MSAHVYAIIDYNNDIYWIKNIIIMQYAII